MKNQISFTTDIFETKQVGPRSTGEHCFGEDLARWFVESARGGAFSFDDPIREDWGWAVLTDAKGEKFVLRFEIMDRSIGQTQADWLITVEKVRKWKFFGSGDSAMRAELCDLVQNVLRDKAHIREIRWTKDAGHFAPQKPA
jgi:hypothetical protein